MYILYAKVVVICPRSQHPLAIKYRIYAKKLIILYVSSSFVVYMVTMAKKHHYAIVKTVNPPFCSVRGEEKVKGKVCMPIKPVSIA